MGLEKENLFHKLDLQIREPEFDKHFMIAFEGNTKIECEIYNRAIQSILEKEGFRLFHQIGCTPDGQNEPGYHAWEVWINTDRDSLINLLPKIDAKVEELKEEYGIK